VWKRGFHDLVRRLVDDSGEGSIFERESECCFSAADLVPPPSRRGPSRGPSGCTRARARAAHHRPFGVLVPQRNGVARRRRVTLRLSGQREVGYEPFDDGLDVNIQSTGDWLAQSS